MLMCLKKYIKSRKKEHNLVEPLSCCELLREYIFIIVKERVRVCFM